MHPVRNGADMSELANSSPDAAAPRTRPTNASGGAS
jgi:hypothetical protein